MKNEYKVMDDGIYRKTQCGENVYISDLVMPKKTFIEAFNKYVRFQPIGNNKKLINIYIIRIY